MVLWIWFFSNTRTQWCFDSEIFQIPGTSGSLVVNFFQIPKSGGCYKMQIPHPRQKWMWLENWLIPGQGWLMFFTTEERFVFCWCAWHGHKATQQRTKDVIVVYANFTTSKCIFVCQMLSLDFEWIHWSHWRGWCSGDLVNSLVHWTRTSELNPHFIL